MSEAKKLAARMADEDDETVGASAPPADEAPGADATPEEREAWAERCALYAEAHEIYQSAAEMSARERAKAAKAMVAAENEEAERVVREQREREEAELEGARRMIEAVERRVALDGLGQGSAPEDAAPGPRLDRAKLG